MRKIVVTGAIALAALASGAIAIAAESEPELKHQHWHFTGPFGTYDRASAQRGFQVYKEVCSACHSLNQLYYRNLERARPHRGPGEGHRRRIPGARPRR